MKAIEFRSKLSHNRILIPKKIQGELKSLDEKNIRVMVLPDEIDVDNNLVFKQKTTQQFLNGYFDSDSIYDKY
jgi:hypothetical protein